MPSRASQKSVMRPEYVVALIGLVGGIAGAVIPNWDKLTGHVVTAEYSGYEPTGNIETELRYLFEVNGTRAAVQTMQEQYREAANTQLTQLLPNDPKRVERWLKIMDDKSPKFDETINDLIPIYKKYFTVDQVQKMNKFYSTPEMQALVRVTPEATREFMKFELPKLQATQQKILEELMNDIENGDSVAANTIE